MSDTEVLPFYGRIQSSGFGHSRPQADIEAARRSTFMKKLNLLALGFAVSALGSAYAGPFDGTWTIDLRSPVEKKSSADCGLAVFVLKQSGREITGNHQMATVGCGRLNEGGDDTVRGTARGNSAELTVTSGRNGEVVRGRATRVGNSLRWNVTEQLKPGDPEGDSGLILHHGTLERGRR